MKKSKLDIVEKDVVVLSKEIGDGKVMGTVLRIVRYCIDGRDGEMILEKRGTFGDKMGRRMGFNHSDFVKIISDREKIVNLLDLS